MVKHNGRKSTQLTRRPPPYQFKLPMPNPEQGRNPVVIFDIKMVTVQVIQVWKLAWVFEFICSFPVSWDKILRARPCIGL
jgi:hypothetical protein